MANICLNALTITGPAPILDQFASFAVGVWPWIDWLTDPDDRVEVLAVTNFMPPVPAAARHDYTNYGHQWCNRVLGTRGAYQCERERPVPGRLVYQFNTAWCQLDEGVIAAMSSRFPRLKFVYEWDEPGDQFEGEMVAAYGDVELTDSSADEDYTGRLAGPPEKEDEVD